MKSLKTKTLILIFLGLAVGAIVLSQQFAKPPNVIVSGELEMAPSDAEYLFIAVYKAGMATGRPIGAFRRKIPRQTERQFFAVTMDNITFMGDRSLPPKIDVKLKLSASSQASPGSEGLGVAWLHGVTPPAPNLKVSFVKTHGNS